MADSLEVFSEIRQIRAHIAAIEHTQEVLIRAHSESILKQIWKQFDADPVLAHIYLLVDGSRTQTGIVEALRQQGAPGASNASVSRKLDRLLNELNVIELADQTKSGKVYTRAAVDRILGISRQLERRLGDVQGGK